jgi:hypothetical protein
MLARNSASLLAAAAMLVACSENSGPASPSSSAPSALAVWMTAQPMAPGTHGLASPASLTLSFRSPSGPLEIVSATITLLDGDGAVLYTASYGPSNGFLNFISAWDGGAIGRKIRIQLIARVHGRDEGLDRTIDF